MSFGAHLARIWRRRFLVAAITLLAGLVAFGVAGRHSGTQYTGTATLITVSQNSSPDQIGRPGHRVCCHVHPTVVPGHAARQARSARGCVADRSDGRTEPDHLHIGDRPRRGHGAAGGRRMRPTSSSGR